MTFQEQKFIRAYEYILSIFKIIKGLFSGASSSENKKAEIRIIQRLSAFLFLQYAFSGDNRHCFHEELKKLCFLKGNLLSIFFHVQSS